MAISFIIFGIVVLALMAASWFFGHETGYITGYNDARIDLRSPESFEKTEKIPDIFEGGEYRVP